MNSNGAGGSDLSATSLRSNEVNSRFARANFIATHDGDAVVELKIAISYVSEKNALLNLTTEEKNAHGRKETFESTRFSAAQAWEKVLRRVRIQPSPVSDHPLRDVRNFYTALYHSFLHPNIAEDVNGEYRGYDNRIYSIPQSGAEPAVNSKSAGGEDRLGNEKEGHHHYVNFSGWDVYRSELQLLAILFPSRASDMAQSLVDAAKQCGAIPQWAINNADTAVMGGDAGPAMIADFNAFGADQFDRATALRYLIQHGTDPRSQCNGHYSRPEMAQYLAKGYLVQNDVTYTMDVGFVSMALEYAASDFAISRFAHSLAQDEKTSLQKQHHFSNVANHFLKQSGSWKNLWFRSEKVPGYLRGRRADGKWITPFFPDSNPEMKDPADPTQDFSQGFVEGSSAQYSLMIPFDYAGVLAGMGFNQKDGRARVEARLQSFSQPWIWHWLGQPARTEELVHRTIAESYFDVPGGLPGNDDLGATSSWYLFATLGLYPVIPGEGGLAIHGPYFSQIDLHLENGKKIRIHREGEGIYIHNLVKDGTPYSSTWINWSDLKNGANLEFTMAREPSTEPNAWGTKAADVPPSFSTRAFSFHEAD